MSVGLDKQFESFDGDEAVIENHILMIINGQEFKKPMANFDISFDDPERLILAKLSPAIMEQYHTDISGRYKVQKTRSNVWLIPNSTAG